MKNASRSAPFSSPLLAQIQERTTSNNNSFQSNARPRHSLSMKGVFITIGRDDCAFSLLAQLGSQKEYMKIIYAHTNTPREVGKLSLHYLSSQSNISYM